MTKRLGIRETTYPRRRINEALATLVACPICVSRTLRVDRTGKLTIRFKCTCGLTFLVPLEALNVRLGLRRPNHTSRGDSDA